MTNRELLEKLKSLDGEQLDATVLVYDAIVNKIIPVEVAFISKCYNNIFMIQIN